jgi:hypothetical protein
MPYAVINAVFANLNESGAALQSLLQAGFKPSDVSVIGTDSDEFREATACLNSQKVDKFLYVLGLTGAAIGCVAGFLAMPHIPAREISYLVIVPVSATFAGFVFGGYSAYLMGGILGLDRLPRSEATITLGKVNDGAMAVSVKASDSTEQKKILDVLSRSNPLQMNIDFRPRAHQSENEQVELLQLRKSA